MWKTFGIGCLLLAAALCHAESPEVVGARPPKNDIGAVQKPTAWTWEDWAILVKYDPKLKASFNKLTGLDVGNMKSEDVIEALKNIHSSNKADANKDRKLEEKAAVIDGNVLSFPWGADPIDEPAKEKETSEQAALRGLTEANKWKQYLASLKEDGSIPLPPKGMNNLGWVKLIRDNPKKDPQWLKSKAAEFGEENPAWLESQNAIGTQDEKSKEMKEARNAAVPTMPQAVRDKGLDDGTWKYLFLEAPPKIKKTFSEFMTGVVNSPDFEKNLAKWKKQAGDSISLK